VLLGGFRVLSCSRTILFPQPSFGLELLHFTINIYWCFMKLNNFKLGQSSDCILSPGMFSTQKFSSKIKPYLMHTFSAIFCHDCSFVYYLPSKEMEIFILSIKLMQWKVIPFSIFSFSCFVFQKYVISLKRYSESKIIIS
jgi:hypothetical protein